MPMVLSELHTERMDTLVLTAHSSAVGPRFLRYTALAFVFQALLHLIHYKYCLCTGKAWLSWSYIPPQLLFFYASLYSSVITISWQ